MGNGKTVAALVGGGSLLGREVRDLLAGGPLQTRLIGADREESGLMTEEGGEAVVMTSLDEDNLAGARMVILAGSAESGRRTLEILSRLPSPPPIIDLTYALEDRPEAYLRAPMAEPANFAPPPLTEHVIAHPAATILTVLLTRLERIRPMRRTVVHVFEPASERGRRGIEELEKQTVSLLTFKQLPKAVYDDQVGFNLLAGYGSEAPVSLASVEQRIERHLAALLSQHGKMQIPSLRLIQAPVFHGYSLSLWVEFEERPGREALEQALGSTLIDVRGADLGPPNIVGMAGQDGLAVGAIANDANDSRGCWFWVAADNLRIMAENGVAVARSLMGQTGTARPQ